MKALLVSLLLTGFGIVAFGLFWFYPEDTYPHGIVMNVIMDQISLLVIALGSLISSQLLVYGLRRGSYRGASSP
jgi:vacuolar-type H+-ATPase subunit I/STV1